MDATLFLLLLVTTPFVTAEYIAFGYDGTGNQLISLRYVPTLEYGTETNQRRQTIDDPGVVYIQAVLQKDHVPYDNQDIFVTTGRRSLGNDKRVNQRRQIRYDFGDRRNPVSGDFSLRKVLGTRQLRDGPPAPVNGIGKAYSNSKPRNMNRYGKMKIMRFELF